MSTVETAYGNVAGNVENGVLVFRNIPYAAAPTGENRWAPPGPPNPWTGVRESTAFGPISWQVVAPADGALAFARDAEPPALDEDCLSLNIWTPSTERSDRPVMVWIHGGAFVTGSGSSLMYDGTNLAGRGDVVVVTINYRLGALGFLNLNELTGGRIPSTGNEGLLDQAYALAWVRDNIEQFGGNPNNVTIFGESAGGMSVGSLLALSEAKGLFHKAIPQSGAAHTANTLARSTQVAESLLAKLEVSPNSNLHKLYELSAEQITQAGAEVSEKLNWMCYQPCIDGAQIPMRPIDCIAQGSADDVKVLVGCTKDEWNLFASMDPSILNMNENSFRERLGASRSRPDLVDVGMSYYDILSSGNSDTSYVEAWLALETDRAFRLPGIVLAETLSSRGKEAYQYLFTVESPAFGGRLKSCHAIDIGYVFGTHAANQETGNFFGSGPEHIDLAEVVMDSWLAFAHSGNPATDRLAGWSAYEDSARSTAILGTPPSVEDAPMDELRNLWDDASVAGAIGAL